MAVVYHRNAYGDRDRRDMDANDPNADHSDDDGTSSDTSDDVVELAPSEIPGYFQERGGRLFHSHGGSPYPLPVDAEEQQVRPAPALRLVFALRTSSLMLDIAETKRAKCAPAQAHRRLLRRACARAARPCSWRAKARRGSRNGHWSMVRDSFV